MSIQCAVKHGAGHQKLLPSLYPFGDAAIYIPGTCSEADFNPSGGLRVTIQPEDRYHPENFDTVGVDCFREVPIQLIAEASDTYFKHIKDLNPHLRGHYVQAGHLQINVPAGKAKGFKARFDKLVAQYDQTLRQRIYVVRNGDSLSVIADKFEVPLAAILIWNRLELNQPIHPGDRLIIYPRRLSDVKP